MSRREMAKQSIVVHGHFYQPPRENPWRDEVEAEASALPFHDWNQRITQECYLPVGRARLLDARGHVERQTNLYEWMSFDAAPTLLRWLGRYAPDAYGAIIDGDRLSHMRLGGHGNAIAHPYHHVILPLASRRDKITQVRWGLEDFRRRFGRDAEGFWLPETAVDEETLVVLAEQKVKFTILAPHQVEGGPRHGEALKFNAGGGKEIALFTYDGAMAHDVAFGQLLHSGDWLAERLAPVGVPHDHRTPGAAMATVGNRSGEAGRSTPVMGVGLAASELGRAGTPSGGSRRVPAPHAAAAAESAKRWALASLATDGETFGHHHKFGEMALARAFALLEQRRPHVKVENYASVLAHHGAKREAKLRSPSSWSCAHGVGRWSADCGCRFSDGMHGRWRAPLREALDWLAGEFDARYVTEARALLGDPWRARDKFGAVAGLDDRSRKQWVKEHVKEGESVTRALQLLDAATSRLGMFGSCAWFFDDISRIESVLMLRLAAHAIDLLGDPVLETKLIAKLANAPSNDRHFHDGAAVYRQLVATGRPGA